MESREGTEKKRRPISVESEFFIWNFFITTHEEINIKINRVRVNKFAAIICEIHSTENRSVEEFPRKEKGLKKNTAR